VNQNGCSIRGTKKLWRSGHSRAAVRVSDLILESTSLARSAITGRPKRCPPIACQFFHDCKGRGERLKSFADDCCVLLLRLNPVPADRGERQRHVLQLKALGGLLPSAATSV
jgi:hypothetical protein